MPGYRYILRHSRQHRCHLLQQQLCLFARDRGAQWEHRLTVGVTDLNAKTLRRHIDRKLTRQLRQLRVTANSIADLLCRLGGTASVPRAGEARRSRVADVPVLALSVRAGETLLAVDRAYLPHLLAWIRETLLDFEA